MVKYYSDNFCVDGKVGWLVYSGLGLYALHLPAKNALQPPNTILKKNGLVKELETYFRGKRASFNAKIDWTGLSGFERKILETCRLIEYGETLSYKELAKIAGCEKASRAAGNALAKNRLPVIIPCHRVIKSGGKLGGFSRGLKIKRKMLELEENGNSQ